MVSKRIEGGPPKLDGTRMVTNASGPTYLHGAYACPNEDGAYMIADAGRPTDSHAAYMKG